MLNQPQERKWYQPSLRDKFMLTGMFLGILIYELGHRHLHPEPSFLWIVTPAFIVVGAAVGELVRRRWS
jgi:hypothetical protein